MKIEKEHIIIRVGGGYLTIEEFIDQYCEEAAKQSVYNWMYGGGEQQHHVQSSKYKMFQGGKSHNNQTSKKELREITQATDMSQGEQEIVNHKQYLQEYKDEAFKQIRVEQDSEDEEDYQEEEEEQQQQHKEQYADVERHDTEDGLNH